MGLKIECGRELDLVYLPFDGESQSASTLAIWMGQPEASKPEIAYFGQFLAKRRDGIFSLRMRYEADSLDLSLGYQGAQAVRNSALDISLHWLYRGKEAEKGPILGHFWHFEQFCFIWCKLGPEGV